MYLHFRLCRRCRMTVCGPSSSKQTINIFISTNTIVKQMQVLSISTSDSRRNNSLQNQQAPSSQTLFLAYNRSILGIRFPSIHNPIGNFRRLKTTVSIKYSKNKKPASVSFQFKLSCLFRASSRREEKLTYRLVRKEYYSIS